MPVSQIVIRPMQDGDAAAMHAIHERAVRISCAPALPPEVVDAWLHGRSPAGFLRAHDDGGERFWLAEIRGLRAGFAGWLGDRLTALFVDPDHQGSGAGRALLAACDRDAAARGEALMRLDSTYNAQAFYERAGFRAIGEGHQLTHGQRVPHVSMLRL